MQIDSSTGLLSEPIQPGDSVSHPQHYNRDPSGVECIDLIRYLPLSLGTAVKYLWRHRAKEKPLEDLRKCLFYLDDHFALLKDYPILQPPQWVLDRAKLVCQSRISLSRPGIDLPGCLYEADFYYALSEWNMSYGSLYRPVARLHRMVEENNGTYPAA